MSYCLELNPYFAEKWRGRDPFDEAQKIEGKVFRKVKNRRTLQFEDNGQTYFIKFHNGVGWREIFKNYSMLKYPVLGANNEYHAIRLLEKLKIKTMTPCAYGMRNFNIAKRQSFLITEALTGMISLKNLCLKWPQEPPEFAKKLYLLQKMAHIVGSMHRNGLNHRDCYICHFLLAPDDEIYVIDLHRAEIRKKVPYRYLVKDVAGLYFSAMDIGLTRRDLFRFIKAYSLKSLREADWSFWRDVERTAIALYKRQQRKEK